MHCRSFGDKSSPALVILHGWGLNSEKYELLSRLLSKHFYVLVPDFPGFGETPEPEHPYAIELYADELKKLLEMEQVSEAFFIGHSFGGRITLFLAAHSPQLVKALVLTGAAGIEKFDLKRSLKRLVFWICSKLLKVFIFLPPVRRLRERVYRHRDIGKLQGVMKETFLKVVKRKLNKEAGMIVQDTLLLWGRQDQTTPVMDAEKILELVPHSYLKIFSQTGHRLPYEKPHEFAHEVSQFFLSRT
ncbi:MAG: alpha/beta hydrolase [bacterium]|nr:alpha/beta hydrolase [bacterium]